jgi:DNA-binding MarR family transcriptional regulator
MGFQKAPLDVVEVSRCVWLERWEPEAASGMAVYTAVLRSYQLLNDQVNGVVRHHDLTFARYEVLAWLAMDPESSRALSWISKTLRIPPATVTNIIDKLEGDKLVRRVPHPSDARTTLAVITARGERVATNATRDLNATVYACIGLSETKRGRLLDLLTELRASGNEFDIERALRRGHRGSRLPPGPQARETRRQRPVQGGIAIHCRARRADSCQAAAREHPLGRVRVRESACSR